MAMSAGLIHARWTRRRRRGVVSLMEYATLFVVVAAAILAMAIYTKRALGGKWREVGDSFGHGRQYEPSKTVVTK